jgi:hypothetical protein
MPLHDFNNPLLACTACCGWSTKRKKKYFKEITNKSIAIAAFIPPGLPDVPT